MYKAFVNGERLDFENPSITLRLRNPMFDPQNGMEWTASFPFKIPATPRNKAILGFPARLSAEVLSTTDLSFEHYFNGLRLPGDSIRVRQANDKQFEAYIRIGRSDFISATKDLSLHQLQFPLEEVLLEDIYSLLENGTGYPDTDYAFPTVKNDGLYDGHPYESDWKSPTLNNLGPYQNAIFKLYGDTEFSINNNTVSPLPFVAGANRKIFEILGYKLTSDVFASNQHLRPLCIYSPVVARGDGPDAINFHLKYQLPDIKIPNYFLALRMPFAIDLYFNYYHKTVDIKSRKDVLNDPSFIDFTKGVAGNPTVIHSESIANYKLKMKNDSADTYWSEKVADFANYELNTKYYVDSVGDLPASPEPNSLGLVKDEDQWYIFTWDDPLNVYMWKLFSQNHMDFQLFTTEATSYEAEIGPLLSEDHDHNELPFSLITPKVYKKGRKQEAPLDLNNPAQPFSLRLLMNRGLAETSDGSLYPSGSSFSGLLANTPVPANPFSLQWFGPNQASAYPEYGLYTNFWSDFMAFQTISKPIEFIKVISAYDLFTLDWTKKYYALGTLMILNEITFTITSREIKPAKVKAWTY